MKICFVSYEVAPTTIGGAGSYIANMIETLTPQGWEVVLLLDIPRLEYQRFEWHDRLFFSYSHQIRAYCVEELCMDLRLSRKDFPSENLWRSYRFDHALRKLVQIEQPDLVEFFDYTGIAYYPLVRKISQGFYSGTKLVIRFHSTIEPIQRQKPQAVADNFLIYKTERQALKFAESVLFYSQNLKEWAHEHYNEDGFGGKILISPPPLKRLPRTKVDKEFNQEADRVLFFGYIDYLKGADTFINAALLLLNNPQFRNYKFVLVGGDFEASIVEGYSSFTEYLKARIPADLRDYFEFTGHLSHDRLSLLLPEVCFAVIPSHIESFGYAAHELYAQGVPLVLRNIPAFLEYFTHEKNALIFDGSVTDLAYQMERLILDKDLRERLSKPYEVLPPPLGEAYEELHQNSWINNNGNLQPTPSTLILILAEDTRALSYDQYAGFQNSRVTVWLLSPEPSPVIAPFYFLGKMYWIYDLNGEVIPLRNWLSQDLMIVLKQNDRVDPEYIQQGAGVLQKYPQISYVGCWKELVAGGKVVDTDTFPYDLAAESLPFRADTIPSRTLFRTPPDKHFLDLFDTRYGPYSEIKYLWDLEEQIGPGLVIPEPYLRIHQEMDHSTQKHQAYLNFLVLNASQRRRAWLAQYLLEQATGKPEQESVTLNPQSYSYYQLADLDLKLLLKKLNTPPFGWLFRARKNFRTLLTRYIS